MVLRYLAAFFNKLLAYRVASKPNTLIFNTMSILSLRLSFIFALLFASKILLGQTIIWQENFSGAPPAPGWNVNFVDCDFTPQSFAGVQNGRFEIIDMEGSPCCPAGMSTGGGNNNEWTTNEIDIAGYCNVSVSVDYGSIGTFECSAGGPYFDCTGDPFIDNGHDQMVIEYSIDGGPFVQILYLCGGGGGTATVNGLSGSNIRVQVRAANKSIAETYWFDNVTVSGVLPTVNPIADQTVCAGTALSVVFSGSGTPPPTFQWTNDNTAIGLGASGNGNINFTPPANLPNQETATITVTPVSAGCQGQSETFTITVNPRPLTDDPADIVACSGDFVEVIFSGSDPNATYNWTVNNIPIFPPSGQGNISGTVPPLPFSINGSVTVFAESPEGCVGPSQTFNVSLHPAVSATFTMVSPAVRCAGQAATFSVNFSGGGAPYTFIYSIDGVEQPPIVTNNDPHNFNVTLPANATVSAVSMAAGNGCTQDVDGSFDVTVIPAPTAMLSPGPSTLCEGEELTLEFEFNGSDDYTFTYTVNGVPQPPVTATGPNYTLSVNPPVGNTNYVVTTVNSSGCTGTASGSHLAVTTATPTALINGNPIICSGQNATIPVTFTGSAPWTFVYSINGDEQPPITTNSSPYLIISTYTTSSTLELVSVSTGNCDGTVSGTAFVTVQPGVTGVLASGNNAICTGESDTLRFTFSGAQPYTFIYTVNGVPQAPITTSNTSFQIPVSPAVPTTYVLTNISDGNCPGGGNASGTYTLAVADPPTATMSGTDTLCRRDTALLSVSFTGTAPWTFIYTANGVPVDTITTDSNPYFIPVSPASTTTYALSSVSSGSCGGTVAGSATIVVHPRPTVAISGGGQICQDGAGTDIIFTFTGTGPWTVTYRANNDTLTATSSVSPLVIPVNPNVGTFYRLVAISDSLCADTAVGQVLVFVFTPANAQLLGSNIFCDSANTEVLVDFTGTGPFTINYSINGIPQPPDTTFDDPYIIPVNVTSTTTYELISIQSPGCDGVVSGPPAVITVNHPPTYSNLSLNCNAVTNTYVVTFDVLGATLPLTFLGGNSGTFNGTQWISDPIPQAQGYSFTFRDENDCGDVTVSGSGTCNCVTEVGTMNLGPISVCQSESITAIYNGGFVNDGNDTLLFVLHSNPALPLGTIYGWSDSPTFGFQPGMTAGTTYYISAIAGNISPAGLVDTSDVCFVVAQGTPVIFHAIPVGDMGVTTLNICQGDSVTLSVNFTGTPPFSFATSIFGVQQPVVSGINSNTYSWTIAPMMNTVIQLDSVADQHCPDGMVLGVANIGVFAPPSVTNIQTQCDYNSATYTVTFDIDFGTPPYNLTGMAGFFIGNSFTSVPLPFASSTFFATLTDANNCGQDTISGMSNCNCSSDAGTMDQAPINLCSNLTLTVPDAQGTVLDTDDELMYILHTNPSVPLGTILGWSNTPSFTFGGAMQTGVTYYISSIVGNPDGMGMIDLTDPCLSVAVGTPIQWIPTPTATLAAGNYNICPGSSQALLVNLTGSPNFTLSYTNNGNPFTVNATQTAFLLNATLQQTATFVLTAVSDINCTGTVSGSVTVNVHPAPLAANFMTNCSPSTQTYTVEFDVTQGDLSTISVAGLAGIYDPATGHFVSNPVPSGQTYTVNITDVWNCGTFTFTQTVDCACNNNAGVMDQSTLQPCFGQTVSVSPAAGAILETGDTLLYFLVSQATTPPNWVILEVSNTPVFNFNDITMTPNTPYFIVAVSGNVGGQNGVDLNDHCLSIASGPTVIWREEIIASLSGSPTVCPGSQATLEVQFSGDGPFNFTYTDGSTQQSENNVVSNPYSFQVSPTVSSGYNLVSVIGAGACPGTIAGSASVTISNPPEVLNLMVNCDFATETYTLTFDIGNGAQPNPIYTVLGIQGTLNDTTFTSVSLPGAQPYAVIIGNPTGCTTSVSGQPNCVCLSNAGTLSNPQNACLPDGSVSAQVTGNQILDPNDALNFVLCSDPAILPMGILAQGSQPSFAFQAGLTAGVTYFIVAVVGNGSNAVVDLSDPCVSFSPGVPVVFHFAPSALLVGDVTVCPGNNASFTVQLSGVAPYQLVYAVNGVPQPPVISPTDIYTILVNNAQQNQVFTLVSVQDANCSGIGDGQATLTVTPSPTGSITGSTTVCAGSSATLTLNLSGANSYDVTIAGTPPPIQLNGVQNGATFSVSPGNTTTYTITNIVTAGNTCPPIIGQGATVTTSSVGLSSTLSNFNGFNTSCPLSTDGSISVTPTGGISPVTALWDNGSTNLNITGLRAGNYSVTLTDQIGCTATGTFTLNAPPELAIQFTSTSPICFGERNGSITITGISGGAGPFSISLNNTLVQTTSSFPVIIPGQTAGTKTVEVEDVNGCVSDETVIVPAPLELVVDLGPDVTLGLGDSVQLLPVLNFTDIESFVWTPGTYLQQPNDLNPWSLPPNSIRYNLEVTNADGCTAEDDILVIVQKNKRVFIPNAIAPQSNDQNNFVTVFGGNEVRLVRLMQIYDRWGDMVFENRNFLPNDPQLGWDGKSKGQDLNPGVYVYVVEVEYVNGETEIISGDITLVR